jgi:2-oxoglutarate dehydrogenase E1 component
LQKRRELKKKDTVILRLEQIYPFPESHLQNIVKAFRNVRKYFWVQEEPKNMGCWSFVRPRLEKIIGKPIEYIGREGSSSPATGFPHIYRKEQTAIVDKAIDAS